MTRFQEKLAAAWKADRYVCVGLDTDPALAPSSARADTDAETIVRFNRGIVDATIDLVAAYKPNSAFYERYGGAGWDALRATVRYIHSLREDALVILDAKRGDIGNSNEGYRDGAFEFVGADALTVHPYMGSESLSPLLDLADKGFFVLCRTSNAGASEFQNLAVDGGEPLYQYVARSVSASWNVNSNCGLVVGATSPSELRHVRSVAGDLPLLIPGVGAQGGDLDEIISVIRDTGAPTVLVNASRSILYASKDESFAAAARDATIELSQQLRLGLAP